MILTEGPVIIYSLRKGGLETLRRVRGFSLCHDEINLIPFPPPSAKAPWYSYDPPHWQLIGSQFSTVHPLHSVGDA